MRRIPAVFAAALTLTCAANASAQVTVFKAPDYGDLSVQLYGWIQPRFTSQQHDDRPQVMFDLQPAFTVQRARFGTVGTFGPWGRVQLEVDFAGQTVTTMDAYAVLAPIHEKDAKLELTFGQFRVPFSEQNLRPSSSYQFADTAYFVAPSFIIDRNLGAMLSTDLW